MKQRKLMLVVVMILVGLFIGTRIKMVKIGLVMGLVLGLLGGGLLVNKMNENNDN